MYYRKTVRFILKQFYLKQNNDRISACKEDASINE